jgi:hypothetical protein
MQSSEVSGAVRPLYVSLGFKGLIFIFLDSKLEVENWAALTTHRTTAVGDTVLTHNHPNFT